MAVVSGPRGAEGERRGGGAHDSQMAQWRRPQRLEWRGEFHGQLGKEKEKCARFLFFRLIVREQAGFIRRPRKARPFGRPHRCIPVNLIVVTCFEQMIQSSTQEFQYEFHMEKTWK